jgi:L-fucose isomerase
LAQGNNAIAAGTQGQRQWTDYNPNFDLTESILTSSFDWNGFRPAMMLATENDSKNAIGMLVAHLLSGLPQLFADIRTNWTPKSIKASTGADIRKIAPEGFIDKRNSGAGALDFGIDIFKIVRNGRSKSIHQVADEIRSSKALQKKLIDEATSGTKYMAAILEYFPGDGLSSHYRTPGGVPMTAYRYSQVDTRIACSVVEGETISLPKKVADHVSEVTNPTWPESYWIPYGMSSFDYMSRMNPNHDANSFGLIGSDMITLNAMLRIPIDFHNVDKQDLFRPTMWDRFGGDDYRVCELLGPMYI